MKVTVLVFAMARQLVGRDRLELDLGDGATVGDLRAALGASHAALAPLLRGSLFAVDQAYADERTPLVPGQEVAMIPPVSGG